MAEENFDTNISRMIAAELHLLAGLIAAHEMFAKSYFSLGVAEKATVDQTVFSMLAANYQGVTPENLAAQKVAEPVGFRAS